MNGPPASGRAPETPKFVSDIYWRANLRLVGGCLAVWFLCSYVFGVLLVDQLNAIRVGGFRLGFWFAQQGSIYVFVVLIFFYAWRMNHIDKKFDVHED